MGHGDIGAIGAQEVHERGTRGAREVHERGTRGAREGHERGTRGAREVHRLTFLRPLKPLYYGFLYTNFILLQVLMCAYFDIYPDNRYINKVKPVLTLCWGACHPHATLTSMSSVYIDHSAI